MCWALRWMVGIDRVRFAVSRLWITNRGPRSRTVSSEIVRGERFGRLGRSGKWVERKSFRTLDDVVESSLGVEKCQAINLSTKFGFGST